MKTLARPLWRHVFVLAAALLLQGLTPAAAADDFLPVDAAFKVQAQRLDGDRIALTWQIADGYYLYRHAFDFALADAGSAEVGEPGMPAGNKHTDEFFGPVETYRSKVRVVVPVEGDSTLPADARIEASYQGCADAGLCYPPQTRTLPITAAGTQAQTTASPFTRAEDLATLRAEPAVRAALADVTALQADVTDYDAKDRVLMQATNVFGPPALLFYDAEGNEAAAHRLIGATDGPGFLAHLERAIGVGS